MRIIAGSFGRRLLKTVEGPGYRPAMAMVREALFSMLESRGLLWPSQRVLDLFAGSGSLAFEALSRGAPEAVLVEMSPQAVRCLQHNRQTLGLTSETCRILAEDVLKFLARGGEQPYTTVFIDPPYGKALLPPVLKSLLRRKWLAENAFVIAEIESSLTFTPTQTDSRLQFLTDRHFGQTRICIWQYTNTP